MANPKLHNKNVSSFYLFLSLSLSLSAWSRHRAKNETKSFISLSLNIRFHRGLLCFQWFKIYLNFFMNQDLWRRKWQPTPVLLPGKSHGQRSLVGYHPWGGKESDTTEWLHFHFSLLCIGEGNGNPLQCSCLENPRDRGACWAAVSGVAQSRTWLKWLSSSSSMTQHMVYFVKLTPCLQRLCIVMYYTAIRSRRLNVWFTSSMSLLIFCLRVLLIVERCVLKSPLCSGIVYFSFNSIHFCVLCFVALLLGTCHIDDCEIFLMIQTNHSIWYFEMSFIFNVTFCLEIYFITY